MGLLEKANAFARAKSLLHRSLELLSEESPAAPDVPPEASPAPVPALPPAEPAVPEGATDALPVFDIPVFQVRVENDQPAEADTEAVEVALEPVEAEPSTAPVAAAGAAAAGAAAAGSVAAPGQRPPAVDDAAAEERLVADAAALEPTIDLPSRLFGLLRERLGIAKGAILFHDAERGVLAPWAACGYDPATLRRMRLPPEEPGIAGLATGPAVVVEDVRLLAGLRRFFSSRESGAIERVLLAPLAADGRLAGVLLATEAAGPAARTAALLGRAGAAALPALARLRDEILRPVKSGPSSPREAREDLVRFLAAHPPGTRPLTVFALSLERCRRRIAAANPWLDAFRLEEDLRTVVSGFAADLGRAVHLGRLRFLVAVRDLDAADTDLFAHQLAALLGSLFHATVFEPADVEIGAPRGFPSGDGATAAAAAELLAALAAS